MATDPLDNVPTASQAVAKTNDPLAHNTERLPNRLQAMARCNGLDRVENAICAVSDAIAKQVSSSISETSLRDATGGVAMMASAMKRIMQSRAMVSVAHRSYAEGDKLLAEAERERAEASKLHAEAAIMAATGNRNAASEVDAYDRARSAEEEAMAALRGTVARPPK